MFKSPRISNSSLSDGFSECDSNQRIAYANQFEVFRRMK